MGRGICFPVRWRKNFVVDGCSVFNVESEKGTGGWSDQVNIFCGSCVIQLPHNQSKKVE